MVVLLNAVWLLLSLAAAWLWLHWRRRSRYSFSAQLFSLGCALIILFPVVSANDDLYSQQAAIETIEKHKSSNIEAGKTGGQNFHAPFVFSLPERGFAVLRPALVATTAASVSFRYISTLTHSFLDRAPPLLTFA